MFLSVVRNTSNAAFSAALNSRHCSVCPNLTVWPRGTNGEAWAGREPKSHLKRDTALLLDDIVDAWSRNVQSQCQLISVQVKRRHKLFSKNLARMNWFQSSHVSSLSDNLQSLRGRRLRRATQNRYATGR